MPSLGKIIVLLTSIATFSYTFYVVSKLTLFLSQPRSISRAHTWIFNLLDNKSRLETAYGPIVLDTLYVIGFILQHSFFKSALVKNLICKLHLVAAERTIYTLTSSLCLHYLLQNWLPAQSIVLWQINVDESAPLWWTFVMTHILCWTIIYGGCFIMDLGELVGIKQAYYDMLNYSEPIAKKSLELRNLYAHVRHPSFVGFTLILFVTNVMSFDRLLLAVLLTTYMYVAWSTDRTDCAYQQRQLQRKKQELKTQ
ncbi:nurim homolog [Drosophila grimshawi]|uniref:Nuclear envelope membrane protein n=1 Tax=Drosophila grimshawi TaxID=7222 RepID=B4J1Q0_DROGR|nr:nurim homolog [Drosophila grimshawi]EDV96970.1 GH14928 [Drosophila grimshawi]